MSSSSPRVAIIGGGPSGLAALKVLRAAGLDRAVVLEQGGRVGGNWVYHAEPGHSSVFATTHIISSKRWSQYSDFPMPADYPDYPSHAQLLAYFEAYASRFDLHPAIRFHTRVERAEPIEGGGWRLQLADAGTEEFDHLLVATGHHWDPRWPEYPGTFAGRLMHAREFKVSDPFRGLRVLVIGGGNSACDIAVETSRVASRVVLSTRRGYHIVPKFIFGNPPDVMNARLAWLPRPVRQAVHAAGWRLATGGMRRHGLPEPEHGILEAHPTVNSELLYFLRHGTIHPRPDIRRFHGTEVEFVDGRREPFDVVIAATGYRITFPFLAPEVADFSEGPVPLYLRIFPATPPGLAFIGLVQPQGCIWPLAEVQAGLVAAVIQGRYRLPNDLARRAGLEARMTSARFTASARHTIEVEFHDYLGRLRRELRRAGRSAAPASP